MLNGWYCSEKFGWRAAGLLALVVAQGACTERKTANTTGSPVLEGVAGALIMPISVRTEAVLYNVGDRLVFADNQLPAFNLPGAGKRKIKSLLNITSPLKYGEYIWDDHGVPPGKIWILVDLKGQLISVFRGRYEIGTAVTLYGAPQYPTPTGHFRVLARMKDHFSRTYDNAPMPYTLRLTNDGVSIHGNNVLEGYASHGCVGVPLDFAKKLFGQARVGDEVFILRGGDPAKLKS
jgi:hypothetical protein